MRDLNDDARLEAILGAALDAADPVPGDVVFAAKEAFIWRTIDAELAELVYDSAADEMLGVRGSETSRQVTFRAPGVEIEVMMVTEAERRLVGQLVPPQQATVELRIAGSVRETRTDVLGRFAFSDAPAGPIQIAVLTEQGGQIVTDWTIV